MSRIGKLPISIPAGVTVNYDNDSHVCTVKGPKGELSSLIMQMVILALKSMKIVL